MTSASRNLYLVVNDYGMGGVWWWVRATSPEEIVQTLAEVEVVTDGSTVRQAEGWSLDEADLDALTDDVLVALRDRRAAHRDRPGFGALAGRQRVYLRDDEPENEGVVFLAEHGPDGRRLRQVELLPDGDALRTDDWPFNPPVDLLDPDQAAREIDAEEFEQAWRRARPDPDAW
ncbi:hypothetical protein [Micromonospora sp. DT47]|uniref:hypothetical protein n=1 Tax=Micromonospora sp. DT47 TaxID=3393431 RepID=UPI003CF81099